MKGKATASVSGRTIAETDEYEFVEGNVYVSLNKSECGSCNVGLITDML
jgi:hypothetical protein